MKLIAKLSLAAFAASVITAGIATAGNSRAEYRSNAHGDRFLIYVPDKTTTVAVYGNRQGLGQRGTMQTQRSEGRWEMRSNAHGDRSLFFVPIK